jgi:hypothetical protein
MSGYSSTRANVGTLKGRTYEATIELFPVRTANATWSLNMVLDHSRNYLAEWNRSCFWGSNASGREHEFSCAGERVGNWWMQTHATSSDHLPPWLEGRTNEFAVNDDGYLVWVGIDEETGQPNSHRDGIAKDLWGQSLSAGGFTYQWARLREDLDALEEIRLDASGRTVLVRTIPRGAAGKAIQAVGRARGPAVRLIDDPAEADDPNQ